MALSRSEMMGRIRGRDTGPERRLRSAVWRQGLRYRLQEGAPIGRPDLVFSARRVAVFVDGCFWHGCPRHYVRPRSREPFWSAKLRENVERDRKQTLQLEAAGWRVCRLWECQVIEELDRAAARVGQAVRGGRWRLRLDWRVVRAIAIPDSDGLERWWFEDLRNPSICRGEVRKRSTKKARAPVSR